MRFPLVSKPRDWWRGLFARVAGKPRDGMRTRRWLAGWDHAESELAPSGYRKHQRIGAAALPDDYDFQRFFVTRPVADPGCFALRTWGGGRLTDRKIGRLCS